MGIENVAKLKTIAQKKEMIQRNDTTRRQPWCHVSLKTAARLHEGRVRLSPRRGKRGKIPAIHHQEDWFPY